LHFNHFFTSQAAGDISLRLVKALAVVLAWRTAVPLKRHTFIAVHKVSSTLMKHKRIEASFANATLMLFGLQRMSK